MVKDSKHLNFVNEIHMNEIIFLCCLNPEGWHLEAGVAGKDCLGWVTLHGQ